MIIAVTCGVRETKTSSGMLNTNSLVTYFNELISQNGGTTLILPPQERFDISEIIPGIDGVIITGGGDINPKLYKDENTDSRNIQDNRDSTEMELLAASEKNNIRTLAICRGHQMLNVYKGGTLVQDIDKKIKEPLAHTQINEKTSEHVHKVGIEPDTNLYRILNKRNIGVNSIHHQCVDKLGRELVVSAKSQDGIIEGIESTSSWDAIGIQWHPEYLRTDEESNKLFNWIVNG